MYAIVKTGGKQYRVQQGESLLVERLPVGDGERVSLQPLLYVDGSEVVDAAEALAQVTVGARVIGHERGPKLRVVKFKPKRGYKRRTGHRQELTRLEVTEIRFAGAAGEGVAGSGESAQAGGAVGPGSGADGSGESGAPGSVTASPPSPSDAPEPGARPAPAEEPADTEATESSEEVSNGA